MKLLISINQTEENFQKNLADDLNISPALAALFELIRKANILADEKKLGKQDAVKILSFLEKCNQVLVFLPLEKEAEIPQEIQQAAEKRMQARKDKNFKLADELRDFISSKGYHLEDTPQGIRVKKL